MSGSASTGILNIKVNGTVYATINSGQLPTDAPTITAKNKMPTKTKKNSCVRKLITLIS